MAVALKPNTENSVTVISKMYVFLKNKITDSARPVLSIIPWLTKYQNHLKSFFFFLLNPILRDLDLKTDWNELAHQCFLKPERWIENHSPRKTHTHQGLCMRFGQLNIRIFAAMLYHTEKLQTTQMSTSGELGKHVSAYPHGKMLYGY